MEHGANDHQTKLSRRVSLFGATMYGVGNILGAGIYALIGEVAGITGNFSWAAFALASVVGGFTGLSYAELSAMFPQSAAEFVYVDKAFNRRLVSFLLGWITLFSGLFSVTTVAMSFGSYLADLLGLPVLAGIPLAIFLLMILTGLNFQGIKESSWVNIVFTLIEIAGLVIIICIGIPYFGTVNYFEVPPGVIPLSAVFSATALVFFAYIGFEDIANIGEEVEAPHRNLPRAIVASIIITSVIYAFTSISVVSILPYAQLAESPAPLNAVAAVVLGPLGGIIMSLIALFATANTVLIIMIVNSRMLYGMAEDRALPALLARVSPVHHTPTVAILTAFLIPLIFLGFGDLSFVANATVVGILVTFLFVNFSVIQLRRKIPDQPRPFKIQPSIRGIPVLTLLGIIVCLVLLLTSDWIYLGLQLGVVLVGVIIYGVTARLRH